MSRPTIQPDDVREYRDIKNRLKKGTSGDVRPVFRANLLALVAVGTAAAVVFLSLDLKGRNEPKRALTIPDDPRPLTMSLLYPGKADNAFPAPQGAEPPEPAESTSASGTQREVVEPKARPKPGGRTGILRGGGQGVPITSSRVRVSGSAGAAYVAGARDLVELYKEYPAAARRERLEGNCLLVCVIRRDGSLKHVELVKSTGHSILDNQALHAVRSVGRFPPVPSSVPGDELSFEIPFRFGST